jgi:hypothetical protein
MPDLRKVQETNKRTLIISLPKRWGSKFPVAAGDHVQLDLQSDGSVLMRRDGQTGARHAVEVSAAFRDIPEVLDLLVDPFLSGSFSIEVRGLHDWSSARVGDLRDAMRRRFGAEVTEEANEHLQVRFIGADRPDQLEAVARRLVRLAGAQLRGEPVEAESVRRQHLLANRLAFLAASLPGDRRFDARLCHAVLRVAHLVDLLAAAGHGAAVQEAHVAWFERAALAALEGKRVLGPRPPPPATAGDHLVWAAAQVLAASALADPGN